jgi:outer membrane receptor for ferrienterochelin and colicins
VRISRLRVRDWIVVAFCLIASLSVLAFAEGTENDLSEASIEQLGHIKVYAASKHFQFQGDAPSSVTIITADEIQKHGYRTLADILQTVRGFFITYDRNYTSVGIRGFARPGDYNTRLLLLVDGHRLNDNIYDEAMLGTEFPIDIDLIARIEVVRGPSSSLYGSNALFGVVNIITRRGDDLKGLELSAEAASFSSYKGSMSYGKQLPNLGILVSGTFYGSQGQNLLSFPAVDTSGTNRIAMHADDDQVGSGLATVTFHDFTVQAAYSNREKGIPTGAYDSLLGDPRTRTTDAHGYLDVGYRRLVANSWDVFARAFYDRYTYQGTYIYPSMVDPAQVTPNLDYADGKWWGTELQVTKNLLSRNRITIGGEYRNNIRQSQTNYDINPFALILKDSRDSFVTAFYLQDEVSLSKSLSLNVGFREEHYYSVGSSFNPRAALIYRPWEKTAFKFIYGESFRVPNVYEQYYYYPAPVASPALKPEKTHSAEIVWEQKVGAHVWLSTSGFYNDMDRLISEVPLSDGTVVFQNLENPNSLGAEFELRAQLPNGMDGEASYSFQETKNEDTGQLLSNSPRTLVKLSLSQPLLRRRMFITLDSQYRSRIQPLDGPPVSPLTTANLTLVGRNIAPHFDLSASAYNVLNKRYFDPPSSANFLLPIQQDGRSFRVKLTWHQREQ